MIDNKIEKLEIECPKTALLLRNSVNSLQNAEYTNDEIKELIFSEDDALDSGEIEEDSLMWQEVRDLQHDIVSMFSE